MKNKNQQDDTISKGKEMGQKVFDETKEATGHAIKALKTLFSDPIGGQHEALKNLGRAHALPAGIVLVVIFAISCYVLGASFIWNADAGVYFKLIIFSAIPSATIFACYFLINKLFSKEKDGLSTFFFTTGVSTIPLAILFFCISILGLESMEILSIIAIFCLSTTFLLINSSLLDIYKLNTQKSVLITPLILYITYYLSKLMYAYVLK